MLRTTVSALAEQLHAYCDTINSDCGLMKSKLSHPPPKSNCKSELAYLNSIYAGLEGLGARADETETSVAGRKENRLNEINLEELLYCAATLYEANEDAIRRLKAERDPSSAGTPFSSSKGGANRPADNSTKENMQNSRQHAEGDEDEDFDGCVVDLSYQSDFRNASRMGGEEQEGEEPAELSQDEVEVAANGGFDSPESKPFSNDEDPKTPSLEAWKLSHATRHILDQQRYISKGVEASPDNIIVQKRADKAKPKNYSNAQVVTRAQAETPPSPGRLDMSTSYALHRAKKGECEAPAAAIPFGADTPIAASSPGCHLREDSDDLPSTESLDASRGSPATVGRGHRGEILSTPVDEAREILRAHGRHLSSSVIEYSTMSNSPATPTLGGTPVTCQVIDPTGEAKSVSVYSHRSEGEYLDNSIAQACDESAVNNSAICSDDELEPAAMAGTFASPPKAVKVLNPRRGENAIAADAENGWIPLVSEEEWRTAPSFLKMQFGLPDLNKTLSLLNKFIAENLTKTENGFSKRLETFSFDEIVRIVGNSIDPAPVKVVVLGLVHFKKLDVGTENSVKVYKIKRFY